MKNLTLKYCSNLLLVLAFLINCTSKSLQRTETKILYFTDKANPQVEESLRNITERSGWDMTKGADLQYFHEDSLQQFSSIFITFSSLNQLNHRAINAMKRYLEAGGGGVVAVKDTVHTQHEWPWLRSWNDQHQQIKQEFQQDKGNVRILSSKFSNEELETALAYAIGRNQLQDYSKATTLVVPEASRYTYRVLSQGLDEPMQMAILPDHNVLFVERKGTVKLYDASHNHTKTIAQFDVFSGIEDGLLGVALDPDYPNNHWVYFYYAVAGDTFVNRLSRMELRGDQLIQSSEKILLEIPTQRSYCCHSAGYIAFGPDSLLYFVYRG